MPLAHKVPSSPDFMCKASGNNILAKNEENFLVIDRRAILYHLHVFPCSRLESIKDKEVKKEVDE
jgi:hypothetical protein